MEDNASVVLWEMYSTDMSAYALTMTFNDWAFRMARFIQSPEGFGRLPFDRWLSMDVILLDDCNVEQEVIRTLFNDKK